MNQTEQMREALRQYFESRRGYQVNNPDPWVDEVVDIAVREITAIDCEYCGGNDETPQDHCMDCTSPVVQANKQTMRDLIEQCAAICDSVAERCRTSPAESRVLQCAAKIRELKQALAAEYTPPPEEYTSPKPTKLVRLTDDVVDLLAAQYLDITPSSSQIHDFLNAAMDAVEKLNNGETK